MSLVRDIVTLLLAFSFQASVSCFAFNALNLSESFLYLMCNLLLFEESSLPRLPCTQALISDILKIKCGLSKGMDSPAVVQH